jgi:hypothetical protein
MYLLPRKLLQGRITHYSGLLLFTAICSILKRWVKPHWSNFLESDKVCYSFSQQFPDRSIFPKKVILYSKYFILFYFYK